MKAKGPTYRMGGAANANIFCFKTAYSITITWGMHAESDGSSSPTFLMCDVGRQRAQTMSETQGCCSMIGGTACG